MRAARNKRLSGYISKFLMEEKQSERKKEEKLGD